MTLPTPDKTWQFYVNQQHFSSGSNLIDCAFMLMSLKESLKAMSPAWTVTGSSTGISTGPAGAMDAVDRWPNYLQGSNTSATVDTTANNTLRIRARPHTSYFVFTVTAGATTAKTTIRDDLNAKFALNGLPLTASIVGTNQLQITSSDTSGFVQIDTVANGSTLSTPTGLPATSPGTSTLDKLVWAAAGSNHSWIVLKQTAIFSTYEVCIDCNSASAYQGSIVIGYTGFSGGSATARPTAVSSTTIISVNTITVHNSNAFSSVLHVMQSTDGECTRAFIMYNDYPQTFMLFDKPKNPVSGWTNPAISIYYNPANPTASATALASFDGTARVNFFANSVFGTAYLTTEGAVTTSLPKWAEMQKPNQISGEYAFLGIGLFSLTVSAVGRHGQIYDMWIGDITPASTGAWTDGTYPNDSSRKFWQCDDFIFPWSGLVSAPGPIPLTSA